LTVPYSDGLPVVLIALQGPKGVRAIGAVVDSGADVTLLPKDLGVSLGIDTAAFEPTPEDSTGAGDVGFPTWGTPHVIRARVMRGAEPWGPEIDLVPQYADETVPVLGRADFFDAFVVTFDQPGGQCFHLDYTELKRSKSN
jgi:hypothetical protein